MVEPEPQLQDGPRRPSPTALALARRFSLRLDARQRGGLPGERLGRAPGSSLEFEDRRGYLAGDDLRHVDWRALARTDQLLVRQYREEIAPRVELLLDASRSMAITPAKAQAAVDLCALLAASARAEGLAVRIEILGTEHRTIPFDALVGAGIEFTGTLPLDEQLRRARAHTGARAMVVCISDFLCEHGVTTPVRTLATGSQRLALVQVLSDAELTPPLEGPLRLTDAETGTHRDLVIDPRAASDYRTRLQRLISELTESARAHGATTALLNADQGLEHALADVLVPAGLLEVRV